MKGVLKVFLFQRKDENFSFEDHGFQSHLLNIFSSKIKQRSLFSKSSFTECLFYYFAIFLPCFLPIFHISGGLENIVKKRPRTAGGSRPSASTFCAKNHTAKTIFMFQTVSVVHTALKRALGNHSNFSLLITHKTAKENNKLYG